MDYLESPPLRAITYRPVEPPFPLTLIAVKEMKTRPVVTSVALLFVAMTFSSCNSPSQGAKTGAIAGAVVGAVVGGDIRSAAIGAGAGAGAGALAGYANREQRRREYPTYYSDRAYGSGYAPSYPVARKTRNPGYVVSPYRPYALIDVRGARSGARILDPESNKIFINP